MTASSSTSLSTDGLRALVGHLGALGDETRIRLLLVLDRGEMNVGELGRVLQLALPQRGDSSSLSPGDAARDAGPSHLDSGPLPLKVHARCSRRH